MKWPKIKKSLSRFSFYRPGVYIIPGQWGATYLVTMFAIFYMGISYVNNVLLAFSFFLFSYYLILAVIAHFNLYAHQWSNAEVADCYAGEVLCLDLSLQPSRLFYPRDVVVELSRGKKESILFSQINPGKLVKGKNIFTSVAQKRGHYHFNRLKVTSRYPLGFFYVWHFVAKPVDFYIYPQREKLEHKIPKKLFLGSGRGQTALGDEFYQHQRYNGESLRRIDWKVLARRDELWTRSFRQEQTEEFFIEWDKLPGEKEQKLRYMAYLVDYCYRYQMRWALSLPSNELSLERGKKHYVDCMRELSQYV